MSISNLSWRTVAIAAMVAGMGLSARQAATARDLIVEVDGRQVYLGNRQSAYLDRGVWMIPAVPVLRAGDVWCRWDSRRGELEVSTLAGRLRLFADSYTVENGVHRETLSRPVAVHHGAPFVPAEFLERCLRRPMHYDRGRDAMCFGDRPDWRRYDGRDRRREWSDRRDRPRDRGFHVDPPGRHMGSSVRIQGKWGGTSVRIRVYRSNGTECINRTASVRSGEWYAALSLSSGKYRAVIEAMDGRVSAHRREIAFDVR